MTVLPCRPLVPQADFCYFHDKIHLGYAQFQSEAGSYVAVCTFLHIRMEKCPSGVEEGCVCDGQATCEIMLLVLNRTKPAWETFRARTIKYVAATDRMCVGVHRMVAPNNFSFAKDCSDCQSGKPCNTCAQKLVKCSSFDMCYLTGGLTCDTSLDKVQYDAGNEGMYP